MTDQQTQSLTVLFMPESAYGPTNQCIGLGKVLLERGHRWSSPPSASWEGKLAPLGFVEALVDLARAGPGRRARRPPASSGSTSSTRPRRSSASPRSSSWRAFVQPTYQALIDGAKYCEPQLRAIIAEHRPDVLVEDNVVAFPALLTSGAPFVRIVSCNPLEVRGDGVAAGVLRVRRRRPDRVGRLPRRVRPHPPGDVGRVQRVGAGAGRAAAAPPRLHPHLGASPTSTSTPRSSTTSTPGRSDSTWHRLDSSVRETDEEFVLPESFQERPEGSALIYLSLGSLGGADIGLLQRLDRRARHHARTRSSSAWAPGPTRSGSPTTWSARRSSRRPRSSRRSTW